MKRQCAIGLPLFWIWVVFLIACAEPPDGKKVFVESGCARCHELDGSGGSQGPRLEGVKKKWTSESLDAFLSDPPAYQKGDARLQAYQDDYVTPMPKVEIEPARRKALVTHLLKQYP